MIQEIELILDRLEQNYKCDKEQYFILYKSDIKQILDYITNLQEENKQLKEQLEYLRSNEYLNQVKWERNFNEELVKDLQQRIDKAIEYIKETINIPSNIDRCGKDLLWFNISTDEIENLNNLLEILGDKENEIN